MRCVLLLLLLGIVLGCANKTEETILEVEKLDIMREKTQEILQQQTYDAQNAMTEYEAWEVEQERRLFAIRDNIIHARKQVDYWEGWHLRESIRLKKKFEAGKSMASWQRKRKNLAFRFDKYKGNVARYTRVIRNSNNENTKNYYRTLMAQAKDSISVISADIKYHENKRPKPTYKTPQKRADKIFEWAQKVSRQEAHYREQEKDLGSERQIKLQHLDRIRKDIIQTQAAYDSINARHTKVVTLLSKQN